MAIPSVRDGEPDDDQRADQIAEGHGERHGPLPSPVGEIARMASEVVLLGRAGGEFTGR